MLKEVLQSEGGRELMQFLEDELSVYSYTKNVDVKDSMTETGMNLVATKMAADRLEKILLRLKQLVEKPDVPPKKGLYGLQ